MSSRFSKYHRHLEVLVACRVDCPCQGGTVVTAFDNCLLFAPLLHRKLFAKYRIALYRGVDWSHIFYGFEDASRKCQGMNQHDGHRWSESESEETSQGTRSSVRPPPCPRSPRPSCAFQHIAVEMERSSEYVTFKKIERSAGSTAEP